MDVTLRLVVFSVNIRIKVPIGRVITDHNHKLVRDTKLLVSIYCDRCGLPNNQHLSWGKMVARLVGGEPLTYTFPINSHMLDRRN